MSRRIANLLNETEQQVTKLIRELEAKNGYPSHDVRHLAENIQKIRLKMADLGLDPDDTTAQELYQALMVRFNDDSRKFEDYFGLGGASLQQRSTSAVKLVAENIDLPIHWALKTLAAKQALAANPPKKLMKYLGYRSVASMLKRENIHELFLAAAEVESKSWQKKLAQYISGLDQMAFEMRPVKIITLSEDRWGQIDPKNYAVYESLTGAASLWPSEDLQDASLLALVLMLAEAFTPQIHLKPGALAVKMNMVMWWADTDHLIAELDGQPVSLNIKDCAYNHWLDNGFEHRLTDQARKNFWQALVNRYKNRPETEASFEDIIARPIAGLQAKIPEPAFEFAEEFE